VHQLIYVPFSSYTYAIFVPLNSFFLFGLVVFAIVHFKQLFLLVSVIPDGDNKSLMLSYNGDLISSTSAYAHGLSLLSNSVPSGVLQERSINRSYDYTRHQPSPTYDNNEYKHEPVHRTDAQYFIQELYRINRSCTRLLPDAELDRQARMLYDHFLTFERYENYRKSHDKHTSDDSLKLTSKDGKEAGEMRWPDHMELAFFKGQCVMKTKTVGNIFVLIIIIALVVLPPQGRKSWKYPLIFMDHPPDDKEKHPQKGRNELIADLIRRWTGDRVVKRKHISSHIQVLKAYVVEDQISKYRRPNSYTASKLIVPVFHSGGQILWRIEEENGTHDCCWTRAITISTPT
jgi:hypothetical protein